MTPAQRLSRLAWLRAPLGQRLTELRADKRLAFDWHLWARDDQLPPETSWTYWLVLAGRGFGKTRTGAEWVRQRVRTSRFVNLIGATADDARDIMIEGESGILAVCPRHERPAYKASQRKLVWPNGATSLIFTADEPERLRGKQHEALWCLTGDSMVLMADGSQRRLDEVRQDDLVATRSGPRRVMASALTRQKAEVYLLRTVGGRDIIGTADHPVWVDGRGFVPLASIQAGDMVCVANASGGAERSGIATRAATSSLWFACIARYGKPLTARFLRAITSTTRTATRRTTVSITSSCSLTPSTAPNTSKRTSVRFAILQRRGQGPHVNATKPSGVGAFCGALNAGESTAALRPSRHAIALADAWTRPALALSLASNGSASFAPRPTRRRGVRSATAASVAMGWRRLLGRLSERLVSFNARTAAPGLNRRAPTLDSAGDPALFGSTTVIAPAERCPTLADVYDIAVEGAREFFANGILVHNCDELAAWRYPDAWAQAKLGLRLGRPQACITTTPKPSKLVRELMADPATHVTRGSTYDNRENLAPEFFGAIIKTYEGTRLGRQELNAEVLEDNPGALWNRAQIDATRVQAAPDLVRIVVGVDPSASSNETSDECGIVAVGMGRDDEFYVLRDASLIASPQGWARQVATVYHDLSADRAIAETNNGGDMVEAVLRNVDPDIAYKKVTATRGKMIRAEPIAALYEQGKVHHVGAFPKLEDQMVEFNPLESTKSPDRMDALVWALTELSQASGTGIIGFYRQQAEQAEKARQA